MDRVEIAHEVLSLPWGCTISDVCQIISFYTTICLTSMFILFLDYETKHEPSTYKLFSLSKVHWSSDSNYCWGRKVSQEKHFWKKNTRGKQHWGFFMQLCVLEHKKRERERDFPYLKLWTNINCCKKQRWWELQRYTMHVEILSIYCNFVR